MKRQFFSQQQSTRNQNGCNRSSAKEKSKHMPKRGAEISVRQRRDCDDFRRKTRLQVLREKRLKAVGTSFEFSEVSIQTLHSICAPEASHNQAKNNHLSNISSSHSVFPQNELGRLPLSLLSYSKQITFCTSETCSSKGSRLIKAAEQANASPNTSNDAVEELWLEVSVEIDDGVNLVVDLNLDRSTTEWLDLKRNSCMLVPPDKAVDDMQRHCVTDCTNDSADMASGSSAEAPSTKHNATAEDADQLTTTCGITLDGDAGMKTAQMGFLAACVPVEESQESSTSGSKELRHEGFSIASLERMPTFLATGFKGPFQNEGRVNCNNDWTVVCIEV